MSKDASLDLCSAKTFTEISGAAMDTATALSYLGQTVLMELGWDDYPQPIWRCLHVLGVVLPKEGVYDHGHFMVINALNPEEFLQEIFWDDIRTLQSVQLRTEIQAHRVA